MLLTFGSLSCILIVGVLFKTFLFSNLMQTDSKKVSLSIYGDQLRELERDLLSKHITKTELLSSQIEIHKRILLLSNKPDEVSQRNSAKVSVVLLCSILLIPVLSVFIHLQLGPTHVPSMPYKNRSSEIVQTKSFEKLTNELLERLLSDPSGGDPKGWELLGGAYMSGNHFDSAVKAFSELVRLDTKNSKSWSKLSVAIISLNNGVVTEKAIAALDNALLIDPSNIEGVYYKAKFLEQDGQINNAYSLLASRLKAEDRLAAWMEPYLEQIDRLGKILGYAAFRINDGFINNISPSLEEIDSASKMSDTERLEFINSMVDGLATRLKTDPENIEDWLKLTRAYFVMKRFSEAKEALEESSGLFKGLPVNDSRRLSYERLLKDLN
jgi:cytochrome c-type biogenesis protein CcmH